MRCSGSTARRKKARCGRPAAVVLVNWVFGYKGRRLHPIRSVPRLPRHRPSGRRRGHRRRHGGHHHRHHRCDRARIWADIHPGGVRAAQPVRTAGVDGAGLHHPRHGDADHRHLSAGGDARRSAAHQARHQPARRAHVRVLFRTGLADHAAGRHRRLRRRQPCRCRADGNRGAGGASRGGPRWWCR